MTPAGTSSRGFLALLGMSLGFGLCTVPAYAGANHSEQQTVYGKTYGEWSAAWWRWAFAGPDGENAVQDETGDFCGVNQPKGKVWFLAGTFGLSGVERKCTIPRDRALLYPLLNTVWTDCPGTVDQNLPDEEVRRQLSEFIDLACRVTSTLDGVPIASLQLLTVRTQSPRFASKLPENHLPFIGNCGFVLPVGRTGRQISDGYWIMLPPLSPGEHTLTLNGAACDADTGEVMFESGVTYQLTVLGRDEDDEGHHH